MNEVEREDNVSGENNEGLEHQEKSSQVAPTKPKDEGESDFEIPDSDHSMGINSERSLRESDRIQPSKDQELSIEGDHSLMPLTHPEDERSLVSKHSLKSANKSEVSGEHDSEHPILGDEDDAHLSSIHDDQSVISSRQDVEESRHTAAPVQPREDISFMKGVNTNYLPQKRDKEYQDLFRQPSFRAVDNIYREGDLADFRPLVHPQVDTDVPEDIDTLPLDIEHTKYPEVQDKQAVIEKSKEEFRSMRIQPHESIFMKETEEEIVMVTAMDEDMLLAEQRRIEEQRVRYAGVEAKDFVHQKTSLFQKEETSKASLYDWNKRRAVHIDTKEKECIQRMGEKKHETNRTFQKSEAELNRSLKPDKGEIITSFGDIESEQAKINLSGKAQQRIYEVEWLRTPQIIEIRVEMIRSLKDKVPCGDYSVLVSILESMGGNALDFQNKVRSKKWRRMTKRRHHKGDYFDSELRFEDQLIVAAPCKEDLTPSMLLLFELFMLKSGDSSCTQVLGWGVFPLSDFDFNLNTGQFKIPMMYGPFDSGIYNYRDIQSAYNNNLDLWLANLYFEINIREELKKKPVILKLDSERRRDQYLDDDADERTGLVLHMRDSKSSNLKDSDSEDSLDEFEKIREMGSTEHSIGYGATQFNWAKKYKNIVHPEHYDQYHFHLIQKEKGIFEVNIQKIKYMIEQIFGDLGFRNVLTWNFFLCLIILLIMMWIRIYSHYLGSWIFLKLAEVPITTYDLKLFTVDLDYPMTRVGFEIGVILCGNIFNILIFNCVMFLAWLFQKLKIGLAGIFYKIISSFGIAVLADFFLILVIDCAIQNWDGEFFKLYNFFNSSDGSGIVGIFIILFIYFGLFVVNTFCLYNYMVFLHMDGHLIDIFTRLTGLPECFTIPLDNEISARYLKWVLSKAKRESKDNLTNPKYISVNTYQVFDPSNKEHLEEATYIAIYKKISETKKVLYRHFIRNPDGSICELEETVSFNLYSYPLLDKWPLELQPLGEYGEIKIVDDEEGSRIHIKDLLKQATNKDEGKEMELDNKSDDLLSIEEEEKEIIVD